MVQRESTSALAWTFIVRVIRHWGALVTGGAIIAGVWFGNSVFGWQIPPWVNLVIAVGFFTVAAFQVWRDEYLKAKGLEHRELRPIEIRKCLDELVRAGEELFKEWKSGRGLPPEGQTEAWDKSVVEFVERHFTVKQSDEFKAYMLSAPHAIKTVVDFPSTRGNVGYAAAKLITKRINAFEKLRREIVD
jgi:hypothetical protein